MNQHDFSQIIDYVSLARYIIRTAKRRLICIIGGIFSIGTANEIIVEIASGEGGADSKLFVGELSSAYIRYAHSENLTVTLLSSSDGHTILKIAGSDPWRAFQHEPGKHCCQRVPPTESKGRRHTSMVSVAVLPIRNDIPELKDADIEVTTCGGHGPGGQHQNKTDSAVRMRHAPTGLTVFINGRSQHANRREARRILAARVAELMREAADAEYSGERRAQMGGGGRGNKIRTYNFMNSRVVDHRLGCKTSQIKRVMKGEFRLLLG